MSCKTTAKVIKLGLRTIESREAAESLEPWELGHFEDKEAH